MTMTRLGWVLLLIVASAGCNARNAASGPGQSQLLTPARAELVKAEVRAFTAIVAEDVTEDGPIAWSKYFENTPAFFMAVNGQVAFPDGATAQASIPKVAQMIKRIDLKWGDDLRIDPLTPELAVVASSWHELQTDPAGHTIEETGYFTAIAENHDGHWQFRNVHWSSPVTPPPSH
jgi:hypothetical protein